AKAAIRKVRIEMQESARDRLKSKLEKIMKDTKPTPNFGAEEITEHKESINEKLNEFKSFIDSSIEGLRESLQKDCDLKLFFDSDYLYEVKGGVESLLKSIDSALSPDKQAELFEYVIEVASAQDVIVAYDSVGGVGHDIDYSSYNVGEDMIQEVFREVMVEALSTENLVLFQREVGLVHVHESARDFYQSTLNAVRDYVNKVLTMIDGFLPAMQSLEDCLEANADE
ncbi:MAG TPA: hypothetical protein P5048_04975, partial [Chlamydiales bacterium]|nr:hypothetical protein [Chlamydiales bacterium]